MSSEKPHSASDVADHVPEKAEEAELVSAEPSTDEHPHQNEEWYQKWLWQQESRPKQVVYLGQNDATRAEPSPAELRLDPDSGRVHSFAEFEVLNKGKHTPSEIREYWHDACTPQEAEQVKAIDSAESGGRSSLATSSKAGTDLQEVMPVVGANEVRETTGSSACSPKMRGSHEAVEEGQSRGTAWSAGGWGDASWAGPDSCSPGASTMGMDSLGNRQPKEMGAWGKSWGESAAWSSPNSWEPKEWAGCAWSSISDGGKSCTPSAQQHISQHDREAQVEREQHLAEKAEAESRRAEEAEVERRRLAETAEAKRQHLETAKAELTRERGRRKDVESELGKVREKSRSVCAEERSHRERLEKELAEERRRRENLERQLEEMKKARAAHLQDAVTPSSTGNQPWGGAASSGDACRSLPDGSVGRNEVPAPLPPEAGGWGDTAWSSGSWGSNAWGRGSGGRHTSSAGDRGSAWAGASWGHSVWGSRASGGWGESEGAGAVHATLDGGDIGIAAHADLASLNDAIGNAADEIGPGLLAPLESADGFAQGDGIHAMAADLPISDNTPEPELAPVAEMAAVDDSQQGTAGEAEERRIDPDTGQEYTFAEFEKTNKDKYTPTEIREYWRDACTPVDQA